MPESDIMLMMIGLVLCLYVPPAFGMLFLILALTKRSWHETRPFIFIGTAAGFGVGMGLMVMRGLLLPEAIDEPSEVLPFALLGALSFAFLGAFIGSFVAVVWGKLKRKARTEEQPTR